MLNNTIKDIIIIGAGGHAAEIDEYIKYSQSKTDVKELNVIGFLDDDPESYKRYKFSASFQGGIKEHQVRSDAYYIIGIANLKYREKIVSRLKSEGANFVTFIHCESYVSESSIIGNGVVIGPNVNIGPNVKIGDFNLLNARSSMGHDTIVGDYNFISPNVCFSGFTTVGDNNLFGINSATIPGIKVGNCNKIAAGMVLNKNVNDDSVVFYRYKERVMAIPN